MPRLDSIFPNEIFALILNNVIDDISSLSPGVQKQESTLCAFSAASKALHALSRPFLFKSVEVSYWDKSGQRLLRLLPLLESDPSIKDLVHELRLNLAESGSSGGRLKDSQIQQCSEAMEHFPALKSILILDGLRYAPSGRTMFRGSLSGKTRTSLYSIIKTYLKQPTFKSLYIQDNQRLTEFPYPDIFTCESLTNLQFSDIMLREPDVLVPTKLLPRVKSFRIIGDRSHFQTFGLSKYPGLKVLSLEGNYPNDIPQPLPTFKLEALTIASAGVVGDLANGFKLLWTTNDSGYKPISDLRVFSVDVRLPGEASIINSMFQELPHLTSLKIRVRLEPHNLKKGRFSFSALQLETHLKSSFPALEKIYFTFAIHPSLSEHLMQSFLDMVPSLSQGKNLKSLQLKILMFIPDKAKLPITDDNPLLAELTSLISSTSNLDSIENIKITLEFFIPEASKAAVAVLTGDNFTIRLSDQLHRTEKNTGKRLHLYFHDILYEPRPWIRSPVYSRSVSVIFYPKQTKDLS